MQRKRDIECFFCNHSIEINPDKPPGTQVANAGWGEIEVKAKGGGAGGFVCPSCLAMLTNYDVYAHKWRYECKRCKTAWIPRCFEKPVTCPHCRSPYWNHERSR